jgi:hypothetical protein
MIRARDFLYAFAVMVGLLGSGVLWLPAHAGKQTVGGVTFSGDGDLEISAVTSSGIAYVYSSSSGLLDSISVADLIALESSGSAAKGDLFYADEDGYLHKLAAGTSGYALISNGANSAPSYQARHSGARVYLTSDHVIATGATDNLVWSDAASDEDWDTDSYLDGSSSPGDEKITFSGSGLGKFAVSLNVKFTFDASGKRIIGVWRYNSSDVLQEVVCQSGDDNNSITGNSMSCAGEVSPASGDYLVATVFQDTGGNESALSANRGTNFAIHKLD